MSNRSSYLSRLVVQLDELALRIDFEDLDVSLGGRSDREVRHTALVRFLQHGTLAFGCGTLRSSTHRSGTGRAGAAGRSLEDGGLTSGGNVETNFLGGKQLVVGGNFHIQGNFDVHEILIFLELLRNLVTEALDFILQLALFFGVALTFGVQLQFQITQTRLKRGEVKLVKLYG